MSEDTRLKDASWSIRKNSSGCFLTETALLAVLLDIRDELQKLNELLHCSNFTAIPATLRSIRKNTAKPRRARKSA